jgi:hypothetical protein
MRTCLRQSGSSATATANFLKSGSSTTPAYYTYTPLWTLLSKLFASSSSTDDQARVSLLKGYYETVVADMASPVDECYLSGVDYNNNDISQTFVSNSAECQSACAASSTCLDWTLRTEDNKCYFKSSNVGFRLLSAAVSGPPVCGSKRENGYEVLVTQLDSSFSFEAVACEYPIATESDCTRCGNTWTSYKATDWGECSWWACSTMTLYFCSSPSMQLLPDDWISTTQTVHYGDPDEGCLDDEEAITITGYSGSFCSPQCDSQGLCSGDVSKAVTAKPSCVLTKTDGSSFCGLTCSSSTACGGATCAFSSSGGTSGFCLYQ